MRLFGKITIVKIHRGDDMKILNIILVISSVLVLIGLFYNGIQDNDQEPIITGSSNTVVLSLVTDILKIEDDTVYILEGSIQDDILNNITSEDGSLQAYRITTSEGSDKSLDEIYEYDRLYIIAENGVNEAYYRILYTD